jgi:hypothetical protein
MFSPILLPGASTVGSWPIAAAEIKYDGEAVSLIIAGKTAAWVSRDHAVVTWRAHR